MTVHKLGQLKTGTAGGMVAIDGTALAVTDTRWPGIPLVYLNGAYTSQSDWRRVIAELGTEVATQHLRRARPQPIEAVGGLFVRGLHPGCRRRPHDQPAGSGRSGGQQ